MEQKSIQLPTPALQLEAPVQFYRSSPAPCPYLAGRIERKLFARLDEATCTTTNHALTLAGFRRSHDIIYKPACPACQACVPVRVPLAQLALSSSQKKLLRHIDGGLSFALASATPPAPTSEQFELFKAYQTARHGNSDMAAMSLHDYSAMLRDGGQMAELYELRTPEGELLGCMLTDRLQGHAGISAVYSFFRTDEPWPKYSLGTAMVLKLALLAQAQGLQHLYLGFWVKDSDKMGYKQRFRPLEALTPQGWAPLPIDV
jgi:arginyl-tRNA--protein-N-Asp/Glu arginylyltransferase